MSNTEQQISTMTTFRFGRALLKVAFDEYVKQGTTVELNEGQSTNQEGEVVTEMCEIKVFDSGIKTPSTHKLVFKDGQ